MTVTVLLRRNKTLSPSKVKPVIKAHVIGQNRELGDNLLRPGVRDVEEAKQNAREALAKILEPLPAPTIEWEIEE